MTGYELLTRPYLYAATVSMTLLTGCLWKPEPPDCPYQKQTTPTGNAGCLIVEHKQFVAIERRFSHKLDFPGGTADQGESARCTAFRETFEETGHIVRVEEFLAELGDGYRLYHCTTTTPEAPLTVHDSIEVSDVAWHSVNELSSDQWRFPKQFELVKQLVGRLEQHSEQ